MDKRILVKKIAENTYNNNKERALNSLSVGYNDNAI